MTAKEQLRERIDELTEAEAADTLDYLARRREPRDALTEFLDQAPIDDEPVSEEEERAVQEARDEIARGQTISLEQLKRELQ
jgi:nucleoid-associated protein YejK